MCSTKKNRVHRQSSNLISALKKRPWAIILLPIIGLAALIWFLIRVVPKPSRAEYPCQLVAAPLASSFVVWLLGVVGSTVILHRAKHTLHKSRVAVAWTAVAAGVFVMFLTVGVLLQGPTEAALIYDQSFEYPDNQPIGVGKGIFPGRVVWVRDVTAVNWVGWQNDPGGFWSGYVLGGPHINRVDQAKVDVMMENAVMWLSGEDTPATAWDALFKYRNGGAGYTGGEKFAIKLNHVTTNGNSWPAYDCVDTSGEQQDSIEYVANSREMVLALLKQLVNVVGVPQTDIYIGDPLCYFPNMGFDYMRATFPNVHYMTKWPLPNRQLWTQGSTQEIFWSYSDGQGGYGHQPDGTTREHDYLPEEYVNAAYLINFAVLKSHNPGITLCGKNHYGSLWRRPGEGIYYDIHTNLSHANQNLGQYRELVDLMGHEGIGGKTLLFLIDGLWAGYKQQNTNPPEKYRSAPFNGEWPALLLASQDPVAIDSVGFDILWNEGTASWDYPPYVGNSLWPDSWTCPPHLTRTIGTTDYLVEAALANDPPSGTVYDPERDGSRLQSLGTHEHWNDDRLYTRNLGTGLGIELVTGPTIVGRHIFYNNCAFDTSSDNDAIAPDKTALLPGGTAGFVNYTSYWHGINGIMIDLASLGGTPTAADFTFKVGNDSSPAAWPLAPAPGSVTVHAGQGASGSDRVKIIWADGAIEKKWLQVTVLATPQTGLAYEDVFYFGNAIGETGNSPTDAQVTPADEIAVRDDPHTLAINPADITNTQDFNRDRKVSPTDAILCRNNGTSGPTALQLIVLVDNQAPTADAGADDSITLPTNEVALDGTVSDDGLPNPPGSVTTTWTKFSGPGTVTFDNSSAVDTTASFSAAGVYVLQLDADDDELSDSDTVQITVNSSASGIFFADDFDDNNLNGWTTLFGALATFQYPSDPGYEVHATAADSRMRADLTDTNLSDIVYISCEIRHTGGTGGGTTGLGWKHDRLWVVDDSGAGFGVYMALDQNAVGGLFIYTTTDFGATETWLGDFSTPGDPNGNDKKTVELVYNRLTDQVECFYEGASKGTLSVSSSYRDFTKIVVYMKHPYAGDWGQLDMDDIRIANTSVGP